ncbi:MAG: hypothetical protein CMJ83_09720 [Planctomycetes bacterium]|nr:hypothetical protein [Planctomycetota bacterium]
MTRPDHHPGFENEPFYLGEPWEDDASESRAARTNGPGQADDREARHSVHNEPAIFPGDEAAEIDRTWECPRCRHDLVGLVPGTPCPKCEFVSYERPPPIDEPSYATWLKRRVGESAPSTSMLIVIVAALTGGPWAVLGALLSTGGGILAAVVFAPILEEAMKIAVVVAVIEVRPYLLRSATHVFLAAVGAAVGFAVIENLLYLTIYIPDASDGLVWWRWSVCTTLHVTCTSVASVGLVRMWRAVFRQLRPPELSRALPFVGAAALLHALYNLTVTIFETTGTRF